MLHEMWTMYDKRTGIYQPPMMFRNKALALNTLQRNVEAAVINGVIPESVTDDYRFAYLGNFDDESGKLEGIMNIEYYSIRMEPIDEI